MGYENFGDLNKEVALVHSQGSKQPGFFKKCNPVGFIGFWFYWVIAVFFISMSSARCYSHQMNVYGKIINCTFIIISLK